MTEGGKYTNRVGRFWSDIDDFAKAKNCRKNDDTDLRSFARNDRGKEERDMRTRVFGLSPSHYLVEGKINSYPASGYVNVIGVHPRRIET